MPKDTTPRDGLPVARIGDRMAFIAEVTAPTLAKGPLIRRPKAVAFSERLGLDARAVRRMRALRDKYGDGPLLVPIPGRVHAVILSPRDVRRVLAGTPEPFTSATDEKKAALAHFEPDVSLVSTGEARVRRRRFNDRVLENDRQVHSMAARFVAVVNEEAARMLAEAGDRLDWDGFAAGWNRIVRRIVLGDGARDDADLTELLERMRARGNLVMLARRRKDLLARFRARVHDHVARGDEGSLAGRIAAMPEAERADPADQIAHYLFAFDPGGMATFRALALVAAHRGAVDRIRDEARARDAVMLPFARAAFLESLRLWPTTPVILRQCTRDVDWDGARMAKDTNVIIFAPFFHRDESLSFAHRFAPDLWLEDEGERAVRTTADDGMALVPFSYGPGRCPASDLVPLVGSAMLAALVRARRPVLTEPERLGDDRPMPGILDNYTLSFALAG